MNIIQISPKEIINDFSFRFSDRRDMSTLIRSVKQSGIISPPCAAEMRSGFKLISGFSRFEASIEAGLDTIPVRTKSEDISFTRIFFKEIEAHSVNRKFTITEKARILQIVSDLNISKQELPGFCKLIEVSEERRVINSIVEVLSLTEAVQEYIGMYNLSLRQTGMFKDLTEQEQTTFIDLAKRMQIRGVELGKIIELVKDISSKDGKSADKILKSAELNKPDAFENRNQALTHLKEELHKQRFPRLSDINRELAKKREMLHGSGLLKFEWDRTLENPGLFLSVNIISADDVDTILSAISNENNKKVLSEMLKVIVP